MHRKLVTAELSQVHDIFGVHVRGIVDDDRLDVAPRLSLTDANEFFPELRHLDLAAPDNAWVFLLPWDFFLFQLNLPSDAVPARSVCVVPRPVSIVWHHPDIVVFAPFLARVAKEDTLALRSSRQVVEGKGELNVGH